MIKVYIDTNIFDYVALKHEIYGRACKEILDDVGILLNACCSFLVPIELLGFLSQINQQTAYKALLAFFAFKINLIEIDKNLLFLANEIMKKSGLDGYDAVHAAAMKKENIKIIITENYKDFKKVSNVKIVRPRDYKRWKNQINKF